MNEHDNPVQDDGAQHGWTARLGSDFPLRLAAGLAMGAVALTLHSGRRHAVRRRWWLLAALVVSWEWGRLVHGKEAGIVVARADRHGGAWQGYSLRPVSSAWACWRCRSAPSWRRC